MNAKARVARDEKILQEFLHGVKKHDIAKTHKLGLRQVWLIIRQELAAQLNITDDQAKKVYNFLCARFRLWDSSAKIPPHIHSALLRFLNEAEKV